MIYDYLFYKSYQLAKKSKNFDDSPVLGGIWGVIPCLLFNIFTFIFLFDALFGSQLSDSTGIIKQSKYIFAAILVASLLYYYWRKSKWKKVLVKYKKQEEKRKLRIHPIIVLSVAYILCFILLLLSGMLKNGDGVFSK